MKFKIGDIVRIKKEDLITHIVSIEGFDGEKCYYTNTGEKNHYFEDELEFITSLSLPEDLVANNDGERKIRLKDIIEVCGLIKEIKIKINDGYIEEELNLITILKNENLYFNIKEATVECLEIENDVLVILIEEKSYY